MVYSFILIHFATFPRYATPSFALCLIPMIAFYINQQKYFTKTYRELKRLDSVSRSPLYALLGETLDGVSTIRAYNAEPALMKRLVRMIDTQQNAYFLTTTAQCWLAIRLELVGTLIIFSACLCAVLEQPYKGGDETFVGIAGLAISFSLTVTQSLNWSVRMGSDLEAAMISVERIRQYCKIPGEAAHSLPIDRTLVNWPSHGEIVFTSAKLRYRANLPLVLKGLDIRIPSTSKIGVVGRTGAGKSTLMVSLLRLVELSSGSITIDGVDISQIGLKLLRSKIAVIPQDPVLFSGTVRTNLDPFNEFQDDRLNEVLQRVGLMSMERIPSNHSLGSLSGQGQSMSMAIKSLHNDVLEAGSNFSVGQRQLLVIARALLRDAKIVIMDEATASVDADTDARIQRVMRTEFKESTCLTVAHRINTILDSDYILVMDDGRAEEFDTPDFLLQKGGLFKDLVDAWEQEHSSSKTLSWACAH
jgi:ATP-binding cassette subfamily C (CFTR/MRP) protein 1